MEKSALKSTLVAAATLIALGLPVSPADAESMAATKPPGGPRGSNQYFYPMSWGTLYVSPSGAPALSLLQVADIGYFPQFSATASPSQPPYSQNGFFG